MFYWELCHNYKLFDHTERKDIGIYSSKEKAEEAMETLSQKNGFRDTLHGFRIKKVFRIYKPRLLNKTYWIDGFDTYTC